MKSKSLLIILLSGFFMLTMVSCGKKLTDAKIKFIEKTVTHLEENYGDMTDSDFESAYDKCEKRIAELTDSDSELTKNQKKTVRELSWRLFKVGLKFDPLKYGVKKPLEGLFFDGSEDLLIGTAGAPKVDSDTTCATME